MVTRREIINGIASTTAASAANSGPPSQNRSRQSYRFLTGVFAFMIANILLDWRAGLHAPTLAAAVLYNGDSRAHKKGERASSKSLSCR